MKHLNIITISKYVTCWYMLHADVWRLEITWPVECQGMTLGSTIPIHMASRSGIQSDHGFTWRRSTRIFHWHEEPLDKQFWCLFDILHFSTGSWLLKQGLNHDQGGLSHDRGLDRDFSLRGLCFIGRKGHTFAVAFSCSGKAIFLERAKVSNPMTSLPVGRATVKYDEGWWRGNHHLKLCITFLGYCRMFKCAKLENMEWFALRFGSLKGKWRYMEIWDMLIFKSLTFVWTLYLGNSHVWPHYLR